MGSTVDSIFPDLRPATTPSSSTPPSLNASILEALQQGKSSVNGRKMANAVEQITQEDLKKILETYFAELITSQNVDLVTAAEKLSKTLPFEELQKACYGDGQLALTQAKQMLEAAKEHLKNSKDHSTISLRTKISNIIDTLIVVMESIINALGVSDFLKNDESKWDSDRKFQKLFMLISLFSMLTAILVPTLGAATSGYIIGGTLFGIAGISILYPKISPVPRHLSYAENLTKKFHQKEMNSLSCSSGREAILEEIAAQLNTNQKKDATRKHPIIIGESGIGKSQTIEALVERIESGIGKECSKLKGMTVFSINVPDMIDPVDVFATDPLKQIEQEIGRHTKNVILVLEEIGDGYRRENKNFSSRFKKRLDNNHFPLVIGVTTKKEWTNNMANDAPVARRFAPFEITNTTQEETKEILRRSFAQMDKGYLKEDDIFTTIYEKTSAKNWPQPLESRLALQESIKKIAESQTPHLKKLNKLHVLEEQREALSSKDLSDAPKQKSPTEDELQKLTQQIKDLEKEIIEDQKRLACFNQMREKLPHLKSKLCETIVKINNQKNPSLNLFMLLEAVVRPTLIQQIEKAAKELNVRATIDAALIDEVVAERAAKKQGSAPLLHKESWI